MTFLGSVAVLIAIVAASFGAVATSVLASGDGSAVGVGHNGVLVLATGGGGGSGDN